MTILTFNRGLSAVIGKELHADLTELRNSLPKSLPWDAAVAERVEKLSRIARTAQLRTVHKALQTISAGAQSLTTAGTESAGYSDWSGYICPARLASAATCQPDR